MTVEYLTRMIDKWKDERAALAKSLDQDDQASSRCRYMANLNPLRRPEAFSGLMDSCNSMRLGDQT